MTLFRLLAITILTVGLILIGFVFNASHSILERVVEGISGYYTKHTMIAIMASVAMIVGGGLALFKR